MAEGIASRGDRRIGRGHRAGVAGRGHLPGVVGALRPRAAGRTALAAEGLSLDEVVHRHRDRRRGPALGPPLGRAPPRLPLGRLAGRPGRAGASRTAAGPPATTAGPAPASASSTWWPRRCRRPGGARAPGQDLASGAGSRCASCRRPRGRARRDPAVGPGRTARPPAPSATPSWARSASPATGTWPGCGSGRCGAAGCRWPGPRGSRPARSSASAWPCPPAAESLAEYLDVRLEPSGWRPPGPGSARWPPATWPGRPARAPARGIEVQAAAPVPRWLRFAPAGGNIVHLGAGGARGDRSRSWRRGSSGCSTPRVSSSGASARAPGRQTTSAPRCWRWPRIGAGRGRPGRRPRSAGRAGDPPPWGPASGAVRGARRPTWCWSGPAGRTNGSSATAPGRSRWPLSGPPREPSLRTPQERAS